MDFNKGILVNIKWEDLTTEKQLEIQDRMACEIGVIPEEIDYCGENDCLATIEVFAI